MPGSTASCRSPGRPGRRPRRVRHSRRVRHPRPGAASTATRRHTRHEKSLCDGFQVRANKYSARYHRRKHERDEAFHQPLEQRIPADGYECQGRYRMHDAPSGDRKLRGDGVGGQPTCRDERACYNDRPQHEVHGKAHQHGAVQVALPAFEQRRARGQLPARDAFVQRKLDQGAHERGPQHGGPVLRTRNGRRYDVPGANTGGGDGKARSNNSESSREGSRHWTARHDFMGVRRKAAFRAAIIRSAGTAGKDGANRRRGHGSACEVIAAL